MPRLQFTLRALLVVMLAVGCYFGGIRFERERQRRADEAEMQEEAGVYLNANGQAARPGEPVVEIRHKISAKWLRAYPGNGNQSGRLHARYRHTFKVKPASRAP